MERDIIKGVFRTLSEAANSSTADEVKTKICATFSVHALL